MASSSDVDTAEEQSGTTATSNRNFLKNVTKDLTKLLKKYDGGVA
jgi:hypothetical protein